MTRHKSRGFGYSIEGGANRAFTVYAQQALNINARGLASLTQQLSTGKRINNSVDDIAGMAISTRLTSQIRGLNQAIRNAYDGLSLMQTAEAATEQVTNMLQRMRELATQASNDTNNSSDRTYLDFEMHTLKAEVNRVAASTQWSGGNILDGKGGDGSGNFSFQVGANAGQRISAKLSSVRTDKALNATTAVSDTAIYTPNSLSTGDCLRVDITGIANIYVQKGANNHSGEAMSTDAAVLTEMAYQLNQNFGTLTGNSDARPYAEVVGSTLKITKIDSTLLAVKTLATTGGPSVTVGVGAAAISNPTVASTPLIFTLTSLDSAYGSAAWHATSKLVMPTNITPILLPSRAPELNPVENIWQYMRANWLSNRVFENYDAIIEAICQAWNNLIELPDTIKSIGMREWAHVGRSE